jgi:DNA-binding winged helix-turn-helix (wHTH) protein/TolB-like protein/Flp pilus assembly protein TadD
MSAGHGRYKFGPFIVERTAYRVLKDGEPLTLTPKLVDVLLHFVSRPSLLVTKEELLSTLWPDVAVTDNALTQAISDLRQALGDDASAPRFIQTVARRGYRFIAPVEPIGPAGGTEGPAAVDPVLPGEDGVVRSVAVLDFTNLSGDHDVDWLATGIAETVTNDLTAFRVLRVVDRVRVAEAVRRTDGALTSVARELGVSLAVVGSLQRSGDRLRITARLVDVASGATMADAKVDGGIEEIFALQDRIVRQFSAALGVEGAYGRATRVGVRETSNLDAFRAASEARVCLDSLDPVELESAVRGFERAVRLDPRYAMAYAGLAQAHFMVHEATRARNQADADRLATAVSHARRAVDLDDTLAEAHANLSFLLVSAGRHAEALSAARRAVALDPHDWRHLFRLGHAAWGNERIDALRRALAIYSDIAFAYYEIAMVHIARGELDIAAEVLHQGTPLQDRQSGKSWRFPASGLHWLLGLVRLAQGHPDDALASFDRELETGPVSSLYRSEFTMNAHDGRGFALLALRQPAEAVDAFEQALRLFPGHARSLLGLAACAAAAGRKTDIQTQLAHAEQALVQLSAAGRLFESTLLSAEVAIVRGRPTDALSILDRMLAEAPAGYPGWTIPIEPLFKPLSTQPEFGPLLARLADRAR